MVSNGTVIAINITNPGQAYSMPPYVYINMPPAVSLANQTNSALQITGVSTNDAGRYFVVVSNLYGSATSSQATLSIDATPIAITAQPVGQNVLAGSTATFAVTATGSALCYQWEKNGVNLPSATSSAYSIPSATTNDTGAYWVVLTNASGSATSTIANLVVGLPPQRLAVSFSSSQGVHLQLSGTPNFPYVLQSATNLTPPVSWQPVLTNLADLTGEWAFTATNSSQYPARFYRMTVP